MLFSTHKYSVSVGLIRPNVQNSRTKRKPLERSPTAYWTRHNRLQAPNLPLRFSPAQWFRFKVKYVVQGFTNEKKKTPTVLVVKLINRHMEMIPDDRRGLLLYCCVKNAFAFFLSAPHAVFCCSWETWKKILKIGLKPSFTYYGLFFLLSHQTLSKTISTQSYHQCMGKWASNYKKNRNQYFSNKRSIAKNQYCICLWDPNFVQHHFNTIPSLIHIKISN